MAKRRRKLSKEYEKLISISNKDIELILAKINDIYDDDIRGEYAIAFAPIKNTLSKITVCEFPAVTLLLSGGDCKVILTPGFVLEIVKVPSTNPVFTSLDWIIAWFTEIIEVTIKLVLKLIVPPLALMTAVPTVSPTNMVDIANEPLSEANKEVDMSGSFGSWLTFIVKSVKLSQSVLDKETLTVGLKGIQGTLPVLQPTQLPQLSIHAVPLTSPLQSTLKQTILKGKDWTSTSPNSELIVVYLKRFVANYQQELQDLH